MQSFHSHKSSNQTSAKVTELSVSDLTKNMNIYDLIKISIQQTVASGDPSFDLNELNDFIKDALVEAQKQKEVSQSTPQSPPRQSTYSENENQGSPQVANSRTSGSPILEQIEDFPNQQQYITTRAKLGNTETDLEINKSLEKNVAERPSTAMEKNTSNEASRYGSQTKQKTNANNNLQKRTSMNFKLEKRQYDTKARDTKSEDRVVQHKATLSQSPPKKASNKKFETGAARLSNTNKKKKKIKDNSEIRSNQKSDLNADLQATMKSTKTTKPSIAKINTKVNENIREKSLTPQKMLQSNDKNHAPDQILTPQPKAFGRRKKSNSNSNIKSPKPPVYRYENSGGQKSYNYLNDDLVSMKSNKTAQQKYENKISNAIYNQTQQSTDQKNKNLTDRISSIGNSTKYDNTSVSGSTISKEIINVMKLSERNKELIKKFQKGPSRKKQMHLAIAHLNGSNLDEFSRIKKPLKQAQIIGKMLCIFLCAFRPQYLAIHTKYQDVEQEFEKWESIQYFLCNNPTKALLEINQLKSKVKQLANFNIQILTGILESIALNETHLKNIPNKNLKSIFDVIHRTLIYIDFKHIKNFERDETPKQSDTTQQNIQLDDSKSYIVYSNYNDVQSERDEGFSKQINFMGCKADDIRSQKGSEKKQNPGQLKAEIYSAISQNTITSQKTSNKAIPVKAYAPLLPNRRSSQSAHKQPKVDNKPKFSEEKPKQEISILNQIVKTKAIIQQNDQSQKTKQMNKSSNQSSQKVLAGSLIKNGSRSNIKTPRSTSQVTKNDQYQSPSSQSNLMQYSNSKKYLQQSHSTQQIPFVKKQYSETTAATKKSSFKELSPTARLIQFKNKTHFQKIVKNAIDNSPVVDYSSVQQDKQSSQDDPLCDLQIFEGNLMMKSEQPIEEKDRKSSTPKSIYLEQYNKDMFSIDAKISESSSKYDEEKIDMIVNNTNPPIQLFQNSTSYERVEDSFQIKLMKVESYNSSKEQIEEMEDLSKKYGIMLDSNRPNKKIDMSTIEELKMRRTQSREKGDSLAMRRDETIKKIQNDMICVESAKVAGRRV